MSNVYQVLEERGFIQQITHQGITEGILKNDKVTYYTRFEPISDSMHIGHLTQIMTVMHMQEAGHKSIVLIDSATASLGNLFNSSEQIKKLDHEIIFRNSECFKQQISKFLFNLNNQVNILDNSEWLFDLNYVRFLREIGVHFSVNEMLKNENYKSKVEIKD